MSRLLQPQLVTVNLPEVVEPAESTSMRDAFPENPVEPQIKPKSCRCSKSNCLKLYCDCFNFGGLCGMDCSCKDCFNNSDFPTERIQAVNHILRKKPGAFKGRLGSDKNILDSERQKTGCRCRKSECLKNYCECFMARRNFRTVNSLS